MSLLTRNAHSKDGTLDFRFCYRVGMVVIIGLTTLRLSLGDEQRHAIASLQKAARTIIRDEKLERRPIVELALKDSASDKNLTLLRYLPDLRRLDLSCCPITDDGLRQIRELKNLEILELNLSPITEKGLSHLKDLPKLHTLSMFCTSVSGSGLYPLKECKKLKKLTLNRDVDYKEAIADLIRALPDLKVDQGNGKSASAQARQFFAIPDSEAVNDQTIRSAILSNLAIGSSAESVRSFLKSRAISEHNLDIIRDIDIQCSIHSDPNDGYLIRTLYTITFRLDQKRLLKGVEIETSLTGP